MRYAGWGIAILALVASATGRASAQPTLTASSTLVAPGAAVSLTVVGPVNQHFAIIGSTVGSGFAYAGVPLAVGTDVSIIATGLIGGGGSAVVGFAPPFTGTTLDRYYVQAVISPSPAFAPLQTSAGLILRNRDVIGTPGSKGSSNANVITLNGTQTYFTETAPLVAATSTTCLVTSSVQLVLLSPASAGQELASVRNAVSRNGEFSHDGVLGIVAVSSGVIGYQPAVTRTSLLTVGAGETVQFGVLVIQPAGSPAGIQGVSQTTFVCF